VTTLATERCTACRDDSPRLTNEELAALLPQVPEWSVVVQDDIPRLQRVFRTPDFAGALSLTDRIGELAEAEGHHPAILTEWGRVTVTWWTHKIKGLHRNDVVMAAKTDQIAASA
jgi:4a-hydroxytetrahydrobiopterin dehydratase